jgi:hypothetical protein
MARALGVGGVFFQGSGPESVVRLVRAALRRHESRQNSLFFDGPSAAGMTVFAHFP